MWGQYLNKKVEVSGGPDHKFVSRLALAPAKSKSETRLSMKKRKPNRLSNKSQSFFGSLGDDSTLFGDLSQSSFLDDTQTGSDPVLANKSTDNVFEGEKPDEEAVSNEFFPDVTCRVSTAPGKQQESFTPRERNINSGWLERCGSVEDTPPPTNIPRLNIPLTVLAKSPEKQMPVKPLSVKPIKPPTVEPLPVPVTLADSKLSEPVVKAIDDEESEEDMIESTPEKKTAVQRAVHTSFSGVFSSSQVKKKGKLLIQT